MLYFVIMPASVKIKIPYALIKLIEKVSFMITPQACFVIETLIGASIVRPWEGHLVNPEVTETLHAVTFHAIDATDTAYSV